jgi:chaperonin cofactor prefoldin
LHPFYYKKGKNMFSNQTYTPELHAYESAVETLEQLQSSIRTRLASYKKECEPLLHEGMSAFGHYQWLLELTKVEIEKFSGLLVIFECIDHKDKNIYNIESSLNRYAKEWLKLEGMQKKRIGDTLAQIRNTKKPDSLEEKIKSLEAKVAMLEKQNAELLAKVGQPDEKASQTSPKMFSPK